MSLTVTVLGCSGSYPGPGKACSGYLVRSAGTAMTVDLGSGTLANLQRHVGFDELDAVVLSHEHPDHWVDLAGLRVALRYGSGREGLPVYGTAGTHRAATAICGDLEPTFDWRTVDDGDLVRVGDLEVRFAATEHYVPTLALRVDDPDGASLAYSADTGPSWSFRSLGEGIDLALCEATMASADEGHGALHLSARQAGELAAAAGVGRLVLTHLWPELDVEVERRAAATAFGGPVEVAIEHLELEVSAPHARVRAASEPGETSDQTR